jgi:sulfoacetaldehyde reductase (NADH)
MWNYKQPTEVVFGNGSRFCLGESISKLGKQAIIVTDSTILSLSVIQELLSDLNIAEIYSDVRPNPTVENVDALTELINEVGADVLIALGGGSSIDCAKAASCLCLTAEKSIRAFHTGDRKFGSEHIALIAVPTTAGTGSEVTPFSVLDDTENNFKGPIASDSFYPAIAVVDPELTYSVPLKVTVATALDALSHDIEGYWSKNHQPICDVLAMKSAKMIFENLEAVINNPSDKSAREALSEAALLAGMAFQLPKNAIMHACSFPLANRFHLSHGAACAFTMEGTIRLNAQFMNGRMEEFAVYCGFDNIEEMIAKITFLKKLGKLPCTLEDAGIKIEDIELLIKESFHPLMNNNPKEITESDLQSIYVGLVEL